MLEKIKELLNNSIYKELPESDIISELQERSPFCTLRQDLDEAIRDSILNFRYLKGTKYISLVEKEEEKEEDENLENIYF